jgi:hypothetical protein
MLLKITQQWSNSKIILLVKHASMQSVLSLLDVIGQGFFSKGSQNTVGEFFNPGYDCADILNKRQDAKDGFYWITLKLSNPKKVRIFCQLNKNKIVFCSVERLFGYKYIFTDENHVSLNSVRQF